MKIIDRYIIRTFLKNYVLSFLIMVGLYVVLDMIFNFDELLSAQEAKSATGLATVLGIIGDAADYYFYQIFQYFVQLSGIIPVVAACFTIMRMAHFNELSAMLSSGTPLLRLAAPMIIVAMLLNVLLLADQEVIIPRIIPKLIRKHGESREVERNSFPIRSLQDERNGLLMAGRYYPTSQPAAMKSLSVLLPPPTTGPADGAFHQFDSLITAQWAIWDEREGVWKLTEGEQISGLLSGENRRSRLTTYPSNITPTEVQLYRAGEFVDLLPTPRINELLNRPRTYGRAELLRTKHVRFTQPLVNVILLLLAIGSVLTREPSQLKTAATKCVLLAGVCMTCAFAFHTLAGQSPHDPAWTHTWPALMAWMPIFIFGPVAVWMLDQVKT